MMFTCEKQLRGQATSIHFCQPGMLPSACSAYQTLARRCIDQSNSLSRYMPRLRPRHRVFGDRLRWSVIYVQLSAVQIRTRCEINA